MFFQKKNIIKNSNYKINQIHVYKPKKTRCLMNWFANCVSSTKRVLVYLTLIHAPTDFNAVSNYIGLSLETQLNKSYKITDSF